MNTWRQRLQSQRRMVVVRSENISLQSPESVLVHGTEFTQYRIHIFFILIKMPNLFNRKCCSVSMSESMPQVQHIYMRMNNFFLSLYDPGYFWCDNMFEGWNSECGNETKKMHMYQIQSYAALHFINSFNAASRYSKKSQVQQKKPRISNSVKENSGHRGSWSVQFRGQFGNLMWSKEP